MKLIYKVSYTGRVLRSRRLPQTVFDPFQDYSKVAGEFLLHLFLMLVGQSYPLFLLASSSRKLPGPGNDAKKKSLAELFKPPHDIMFHGSFHEVYIFI